MTDKQSEALRLADALDYGVYDAQMARVMDKAAAELRRLAGIEAERNALFQIVEAIEMALKMGIPAFEVLRASSSIRGEMQSVIAKAQGGGNG